MTSFVGTPSLNRIVEGVKAYSERVTVTVSILDQSAAANALPKSGGSSAAAETPAAATASNASAIDRIRLMIDPPTFSSYDAATYRGMRPREKAWPPGPSSNGCRTGAYPPRGTRLRGTMRSAILIYDGECPVCVRTVEWVRDRSRPQAFEFLSCHSTELARRFPKIRKDACLQAMH